MFGKKTELIVVDDVLILQIKHQLPRLVVFHKNAVTVADIDRIRKLEFDFLCFFFEFLDFDFEFQNNVFFFSFFFFFFLIF